MSDKKKPTFAPAKPLKRKDKITQGKPSTKINLLYPGKDVSDED